MLRRAQHRDTRQVVEPLESRAMLSATMLNVNTTADVVDSSDAFLSLREAVLAANASPGDEEIVLPAGHYVLTRQGANEDFAQTGDLDIRDSGSLKIIGAGRDETIVDAGPLMVEALGYGDRIFHVHRATFEMSDLTLTGGTQSALFNQGGLVSIASASVVDNSGGGIRSQYGSSIDDGRMVIHDSYIARNTGSNGGGVFNNGTLVITNSTLEANHATFQGGAILGGQVSRISLIGCTIRGNTSDQFAAAVLNGGWFYMESTLVIDNHAPAVSAILSFPGMPTVINRSVIANNSGGATILAMSPSTVVANSLIANNSSNHDGGGVHGLVELLNSTVVGNRANADGLDSGSGGGVFGNATLRNSIVAGNVVGPIGAELSNDIAGMLDTDSAYNLIGDPASSGGLIEGVHGNLVGNGTGGLLDLNSALDLVVADHGGLTPAMMLIPGSRAIDAGDPSFDPQVELARFPTQFSGVLTPSPLPQFDQRGPGYPRVVSDRIDIGATEFAGNFTGSVVGRKLFYNHSPFDGGPNGGSLLNSFAVDRFKHALLPDGSLADASNVTSYSRGINGIMVDLAGSHPDITADDFIFRVGATNDPASWAAAPAPLAIQVYAGQGVGGADRIVITWPDGAIKNTYLQVIVAANADTGLAESDGFFFGNRVGESFSTQPPASFVTSAADELAARNATPNQGLDVTNRYDFDKSRSITAADMLIARNNPGLLPRIQISPPGPASPLAAGATAGEAHARSTSLGQVPVADGNPIACAIAIAPARMATTPETAAATDRRLSATSESTPQQRLVDRALSMLWDRPSDSLASLAGDDAPGESLAQLEDVLVDLAHLS